MNYAKLENKICTLINRLSDRLTELIESRKEVTAKLKVANRASNALWDEYSRIEVAVGAGEWIDMLIDLDDDIEDLTEAIEELEEEFNEYDDAIADIEYAFENATTELENGVYASKRY